MRFTGSGFRLELRGICYTCCNEDIYPVSRRWECTAGERDTALSPNSSLRPIYPAPRAACGPCDARSWVRSRARNLVERRNVLGSDSSPTRRAPSG